MEAATRAKTAVEDAQRDLRRRRDEKGEIFVPRYFELRDGRWCPKLRYVVRSSLFYRTSQRGARSSIPQDASEKAIHAVESWIWPSA